MPKRPKSGPPYADIPDEVYVVVTNPWGMHQNPRSRSLGDFNRIASWAQYALRQTGLTGGEIPTVECIYGMSTRDEVIIQFAAGTNVVPLLGEHRWADFWKHCPSPNDLRSTCVFLYNWRNNGDPSNHNWTENFPESIPLDTVPAKSPYPVPSWASPPSATVNLVLPIPRPAVLEIPNYERNPGREQQSVTSPPPPTVTSTSAPSRQRDELEYGEQPAANGLFKPYEPPPQHPSHTRFFNQSTRAGEPSSSKALQPFPKFIKKLDPYELDEDALNIIRASTPQQQEPKEVKTEDIKPAICHSVKEEPPQVKTEMNDDQHNVPSRSSSEYQPSQALIDAFNSIHRSEQSSPATRSATWNPRTNAPCQIIPPASVGYRPSAELEASVNTLLRGTTAAQVSSLPGSNARLTSDTRVIAVKREYEGDISTSSGLKKIKVEQD